MKEILDYFGFLLMGLSIFSGTYLIGSMLPSVIIFSAVVGVLLRKFWMFLEKRKSGIYLISIFCAVYALLAYKQLTSGQIFWMVIGFGWIIIVVSMMKTGIDNLANV